MDWRPDEAALSGTTRLTAADVAGYERTHSFDPSEEIGLLRRLGLSASDRVVDFGAGPGGFAMAAAAVAAEVIAVDPSPAMCAHLRSRLAAAGVANVSVAEAGFLTYRHPGPPAQFAFSRNALHHLPDFWKVEALHNVAGLLAPGGLLRLRDVVYSFPPAEAERRVAEWVASADAAGWTADQLTAHVRTEFSTYAWLLEAMLERAGFTIEDSRYAESGFFAYYTCRLA